jgi:hypothetical protein
MLRNLALCAAACCGAVALANMVWATGPGDSKGSKAPMATGKGTPLPTLPKVTVEPNVTPKKSIAPLPDKVKIPDGVKKIDPLPFDPKPLPKPVVIDKSVKLPAGPAIKLAKDVKFDAVELGKVKPPVDLTKISKDKVVAMKPPADFKVKPIDVKKIHIPTDAVKVDKLTAKLDLKGGAAFILNKHCYTGTDYCHKFGVKCAWGWCYHGHHHCHWHHCIWDPCCHCYYYYDPCCSCYYYWCATESCYYPCWWFVDYGGCYYPWWMCGGFESFGYHCHPGFRFHVHVGW